jgi:hypothetical protein
LESFELFEKKDISSVPMLTTVIKELCTKELSTQLPEKAEQQHA